MTAAIITPYLVALRFVGLAELPGAQHAAAIVAMMQLTDPGVHDDETPWCSGFVNYVAWLLGVARSKSLTARSWLAIGAPIDLADARAGWDVVILKRNADEPPATELRAPGHVGFFSSYDARANTVTVLGGNQSNRVGLQRFPVSRVLGVRRLT